MDREPARLPESVAPSTPHVTGALLAQEGRLAGPLNTETDAVFALNK